MSLGNTGIVKTAFNRPMNKGTIKRMLEYWKLLLIFDKPKHVCGKPNFIEKGKTEIYSNTKLTNTKEGF